MMYLMTLLAVLLDIVFLSIYFNVFFSRKELSKIVLITIYIGAGLLYYFIAINSFEAYQRTICYIAICLLLSCIYQGVLFYKVLFTVLYAGLGIVIDNVVLFLLMIFDNYYPIIGFQFFGTLLSSLFFLIVISVLWYMIKKKQMLNVSKYLIDSYWGIVFSVLTIISITISLAFNYLTLKQGIENGLLIYFFLECSLVIFIILLFFVFKEMECLQQEKLHATLLEQQIRIQENFYREFIEKNQQLKKIIHDEKNFLLGIRGVVQDRNTNCAIEKIDEKIEQLISNITDYTGVISLDTILTVKIEQARKLGIIIRPAIALYGEVYIDFLDLVLLLGNALDNAIEAAAQTVKNSERTIYLTMKLQNEFLLLEVRNPVKEKVLIHNNWVETTKKDSELHGLGLSSMKLLVEKYNGAMQLKCNETTFYLKILLENESE